MARDVEDVDSSSNPKRVRFCNFMTGQANRVEAHENWVKDKLAPLLKANPGAWVDLIGYASKLGYATGNSAEKNTTLSEKRCAEIQRMIVRHHPTARINVVEGRGASESAGGRDNDDGYWRAVKVLVYNAPKDPGGGGGTAPTHQDVIRGAFERSRQSLRAVVLILQKLEADIERADRADGNAKILAIAALGRVHARNIAVLSLRLKVSPDPLSAEFRSALRQARTLIQRNLTESSTIIDEGEHGRCDPDPKINPNNQGRVPFANTAREASDPRVSVCTPFFGSNADLQRDVITHEFFHLLGLGDISVANTTDALNNANTMAQVVAFLNDRSRQQNSDGNEQAVPPLPTP
jgi:hypothetical protein